MDTVNDKALRYYEATLKRNRDAWARKKQAKIDAGEYRGRGRPRKYQDPPYPPNPKPAEVVPSTIQ